MYRKVWDIEVKFLFWVVFKGSFFKEVWGGYLKLDFFNGL